MATYSDEDLLMMSKEAEAIGDLLRATDKILLKEEKGEGRQVGEDNNVVYVDFGIAQEFKKLETTPMKIGQVLELYHNWAERVFLLAMQNSGRLKKGKLREHVAKTLAIVATITRILPMSDK